MPGDPRLYLEDIQEACRKIEQYVQSSSHDEFTESSLVVDAVVRRLEIIGEAANQLPDRIKQQASEVEWRKITGLRNILIHEYFGVDLEILRDLVENKVPELRKRVERLLEELNGG